MINRKGVGKWAIFIATLPLAYFYGKYTAGISGIVIVTTSDISH